MNIHPNKKSYSQLKALCGVVLVGAATVCNGFAAVSDGLYTPGEYANVQPLTFQLDNGKPVKEKGILAWDVDAQGNVSVAFVEPLTLNDNTYGVNSIGWADPGKTGGHTFGNLTGSDKAHFDFTSGGKAIMSFDLDYLSSSKTAPSGFVSLGVTGGDGKVSLGNAANVTSWGTSLAYNFNTLGYVLTTDSPKANPQLDINGDIDYSKPYILVDNTKTGWQFAIVYEATIAAAAFGPLGFGGVSVPYAHNSPSKVGDNTVPTIPNIPEVSSILPLGMVMAMGLVTQRLRRRRSVA